MPLCSHYFRCSVGSKLVHFRQTGQDEDVRDLDFAPAGADPRAARVVELRIYGGFQVEEVAEALGVSVITVKRDWKVAHAWLVNRLTSKVHRPNMPT